MWVPNTNPSLGQTLSANYSLHIATSVATWGHPYCLLNPASLAKPTFLREGVLISTPASKQESVSRELVWIRLVWASRKRIAGDKRGKLRFLKKRPGQMPQP
jgi:hypothetical protein